MTKQTPSGPISHGAEPIAIVGAGCRFAGDSSSPPKLWDLLREPRDLSTKIPDSRFNADAFYHPDGLHHGTSNVRHSYVLSEDHRHFDATFFNIKPSEANSIDPQQRLLLETVYEGLESAGLSIASLQGSDTAVYVGVMSGDYADMLNRDVDSFPTYHATGTSRAILSNRISYFFDWHGPCMTIDTACSSSLIALHQAVQVLRSGQARVAVAAGANLILGPEPYVAESKLKMLSPTGQSRMWDAGANGYARGDGFAAVVLKPLRLALADGDEIHCVVRETGTNQDGKTNGITMPSHIAQAALIRDTYARANLDLTIPSHRPQFFEAHGTGTPAGDPIEAEAISSAFFADGNKRHQTLYVGSIKTVLGHTEGTAGLAGVLKAALALRHSTIPPNLLFETLNPAVKPFYGKLQIPTKAMKWPDTHGGPRRVSVNSFGFGGANAHAILEWYDNSRLQSLTKPTGPVFIPFTFSAATERSLSANLQAYSRYIEEHKDKIDASSLAWNLSTRRSALAHQLSISAVSLDKLSAGIDTALSSGKPIGAPKPRPSNPSKPAILGIFTGQGAQWAGMGRELILGSPFAARFIGRLEDSLAQLPLSDRPSWSLTIELCAGPSTSRIQEAALSQPLCTAIQLLLVELLRAAGIKFSAVVGHSSGEIAAAYSAGAIATPENALRIAYYRGLYAKLAQGPEGQRGAMLAVGTSLDDATELIALPNLEGRVAVAASNSPASVTLSGDEDAIENAKDIFEEEKKFVRLLKVDKAYHSHHMLRASEPYLTALRNADIAGLKTPDGGAAWFSSVVVKRIREAADVQDTYWSDNMLKPVFFSQALDLAVSEEGPFDLAIEIGPHPALKGPAQQTVQASCGSDIPYTGSLRRNANDVEALSDALAFASNQLGDGSVSFTAYDTLLSDGASRSLITDLPSYQWDHSRIFWHESRVSKAYRTRSEPVHVILGTRQADGARNQLRWRNVLQPREIPWLSGHQIQGQIVFPAAAYIAAAIEAARYVAGEEPIRMLEVRDVAIGQAIPFDDEVAGIETLFLLSDIERTGCEIRASWYFYSAIVGGDSLDLALNTSGKISIELGETVENLLPARGPETYNLVDVGEDQFYNSLNEVGYQYSGPFRALKSLRRRLGFSTGAIVQPSAETESQLLVHPATFDAAIQSIILAFCWPGDGRLKSIHVPTDIKRIRIDLSLWLESVTQGQDLSFDASIAGNSRSGIEGDVDIFAADGRRTILQVEAMTARPFSQPTAADDFHLFSEIVWSGADPDGELVAWDGHGTQADYDLAYTFERVAYYYLRQLDSSITPELRKALTIHHKSLLHFTSHVLSSAASGKHQYIRKSWLQDSHSDIFAAIQKYPSSIDLRIMHAVGENLPAVVRGETTILEHMLQDNMLNDYYVDALGFHQYTQYLARLITQLVHRYPAMDILEIGAGTGGATKSILREIEQTFASYTFTDISSGFFEKAQQVFDEFAAKMTFKTLNIEIDPQTQGYAPHSFDLIVASLVLHATQNLEQTLLHVRRLLKPGGYLVILEITNNGQARLGFVFGGLPGWWLGRDDGRVLSPCVTPPEWDAVFRRTGFSGIATITPDWDPFPYPLSVIATQAVDRRVEFLRSPLAFGENELEIEHLTILGHGSASSLRLLGTVIGFAQSFVREIQLVDSLASYLESEHHPGTVVLSLIDLDASIFSALAPAELRALQLLFEHSKSVVWVTRQARTDNPHANMITGFARTLLLELPHLRFQYLDLGPETKGDARTVTETVLRFEAGARWKRREGEAEDPLLWSAESELVFDQGRYLVPRLKLDKARNRRYNSAKRVIHQQLGEEDAIVTVTLEKGAYVLREQAPWTKLLRADAACHEQVHVAFSTLQGIRTPENGYLFLVVGFDRKGGLVATFSNATSSRLWVPAELLVSLKSLSNLELPKIQRLLADFTLATSILTGLRLGDNVVILDADEDLQHHLRFLAAKKGVSLTLLKSTTELDASTAGTIHPNAPHRKLLAALPEEAAVFVTFSEHLSLAARIIDELPNARFDDFKSLVKPQARQLRHASMESAIALLQEAVQTVRTTPIPDVAAAQDVNIVKLPDVSQSDVSSTNVQIIDWKSSTQQLSVQVEPVDSGNLFAANKTYWLVGLTGGLGQSLASWMVRSGARNIVLTSRNPNVDSRWLEDVTSTGASINIWSSDITDKQSVQDIVSRIDSTLPPLGGVAQGAMVLQDSLFVDITLEKFSKVLGPKVNGSQYLEELIGHRPLDFFVFFSSMAAVTGNGGQSHYAAANSFMTGLAAQRRKRGLAASVINIGAIIGNGYVTRELTEAQQKALRSYGNIWMSEQDFHQIFAEGVVSSHPRSGLNHEIMTGLRLIDADATDKTTWFDNPKFQHFVVHRGQKGGGDASATASGGPVRVQLHAATSNEQVAQILSAALTAKLQTILQMNVDEAKQRLSTLDVTANDLGVDSLVAVEIRTWFLRELDVDMPVLKILGGASLHDLLAFTIEKLPASLLPTLGTELDVGAAADHLKAAPNVRDIVEAVTEEFETVVRSVSEEGHGSTELVASTAPLATSTASTVPPPAQQIDFEPVVVEPESTPASSSSSVLPTSSNNAKSEDSWDMLSDTDSLDSQPKSKFVGEYPLSAGQSRFYFLQQYLEDKSTFNITCAINLTGNLRIADLERAVTRVAQRHASLRTTFFVGDDGQPKQGIFETALLKLERKDISDEREIADEFERMKKHVFDLGSGQLMRLRLLSISPKRNHLIIGYHHINFDGISLEIFLRDIQKAYDGDLLDRPVLQYHENTLRQGKDFTSGQLQAELVFWRKELQALPPPLPVFPLAHTTSRQPLTEYSFNTAKLHLDAGIARRVEAASKRLKVAPFHFHLATLQALIVRNVGVEDFCIGMADGNRNAPGTLDSIGFYLNLLPLRFNGSQSQTFSDAVKDAKKKVYSALAHSRLPFDTILSELNIPRSASHTPIYQALINYRPGVEESRPFCGCTTDGLEFESGRTSDDVVLDIVDNAGGNPLLTLHVQRSLYSEEAAGVLLGSYVCILDAFARNTELRVGQVRLYGEGDVERAVELGRGPFIESRWEKTLTHHIAKIIERHGSRTAVVDGNIRWTYKQLAARVEAIAASLLKVGVKTGSAVAVLLEPTADWAASLLAIFKIGAVYVPLDYRVPAARITSIVEDSRPTAILSHAHTHKLVQSLQLSLQPHVIDVSTMSASTNSTYNVVPILAQADRPALLIYTSGTTGVPKGISITHAGLLVQIEVASSAFGLENDTVLQQGAYSFDISIWQTFFALANGGKLVIASKTARLDLSALVDLVVKEKITTVAATPSELQAWLRVDEGRTLNASGLKTVIAGGELVSKPLLQAFSDLDKPGLRLFNAYGPSEITIASNATEIQYRGDLGESRTTAVGRSLPNYSVYILDENSKPVPVGISGEIYIGGAGVAKGYLNNDALTQEKFIEDNYASNQFLAQGWNTAHRTGDRGRLLPDGALVVEGRIDGDTQIKLRGVRVDLRDIESTIIKQADGLVEQVVVSLRNAGSGSSEFLAAHAVLSSKADIEDPAAYLSKLRSVLPLPQYILPAVIIPINTLPQSVSGKVSRIAVGDLPVQSISAESEESATLSPQEETIKGVWLETLPETAKQLTIGPSTDFFHVGGNSLLLVQLQKNIERATGVKIALVTMFEFSTLRALTAKIYPQEAVSSDNNCSSSSIIDWSQETQLPSDILSSSQPKDFSTRKSHTVRVVVLTGGTGFLGQALLRELLEDRNTEKIHVLAVRSPHKAESLHSSWKVEVHAGDLTSPLLGLSSATADRIFSGADAVIHNGADVSFLKTYSSLRPANVDSTKELLRLSVQHGVAFHYISTAGVAQLTGKDEIDPVSLGAFEPPPDGSAGYISSKWVSEQLLEKASAQLGLQVVVHRPSSITGTGAPEDDVMQNLLRYSKQLALVPEFRQLRGYLNFVPVEEVAFNTVRDVLVGRYGGSEDEEGIRFAHHVGPRDILLSHIKEYLEKEIGRRFAVVSLEKWLEEARKVGLGEGVATYLSTLEGLEQEVVLPRLRQ